MGEDGGPLEEATTMIHGESSMQSNSVQFLAPFNPSMDMMRHGHDPTLFNTVITPHMPDATPLVAQWFYDLVEYGHVQTVCTALLALGPERLRLSEWITEARVESWFTSYLGDNDARRMSISGENRIETPGRMRWKSGSGSGSGVPGAVVSTGNPVGGAGPNLGPGNSTLGAATVLAPNVAILNQASTTLSVRCGRCSKPLHANESTQRMTGHAGWACSRHTTTADPANVTCALCHLTVRGLFVWCRGCSHGGHLEHMQCHVFLLSWTCTGNLTPFSSPPPALMTCSVWHRSGLVNAQNVLPDAVIDANMASLEMDVSSQPIDAQ
ncbi:unnamed protein product [Echinostoma caproni]|uniref:Uncharacterized protein n=1 Tax=Echinostoma caproni TaxID=27848 RepID=A0A3P8FVB1_9TREM|nr:unnamed protein product [Echinostoma caproni]